MISIRKTMRFLCFFLLFLVLNGCKDDTTGVVATSIEIDMSQVGTSVAVGTFDLTDVILIITYSDNSVQQVTLTQEMIQDFDQGLLTTVGMHTFIVQYSGLTAQFVIDFIDETQLLTLPAIESLVNFSFSLSISETNNESYEIIIKRDGNKYVILDEDGLLNQSRIYSFHDGNLQQVMIQFPDRLYLEWPDCWNRMSSADSTIITDGIDPAMLKYLTHAQTLVPTSINLEWFTFDQSWYTLKTTHFNDMNVVLSSNLSITVDLSEMRFSLIDNTLRYEFSGIFDSTSTVIAMEYGHIDTTVIEFSDFDVCSNYAFDYIDLSANQDAYLLSKYYGYDASVIINIMNRRLNLTHIGPSAFKSAKNLVEIGIPATVSNIGDEAFKDNPLLETVYVENITPPALGTDVFANTSSNLKIYVPDESLALYKSAPDWVLYSNHIYAKHYPDPSHFFVRYDPNNANDSFMNIIIYNTSINGPEHPINLGYTFIGWFEEDSVDPFVFGSMPAHDIYLEARYEQNEYIVSFIASEVDPIVDHHYYYDEILDLPTLKLDDYTFEGWYEDDDFTVPFMSGRMPDKHLTLHAKFSRIENKLNYYSEMQIIPKSMSTAGESIYILTENHRLVVWGRNNWGELGVEDNHIPTYYFVVTPLDITDTFNLDNDEWIDSIYVGSVRAFALTSKGNIYAFGMTDGCLLGYCKSDTPYPQTTTKPVNITDAFNLSPQETIIMVTVGTSHNLVLSSEGRLFAWGENYDEALGFTTYSSVEIPRDFTNSFSLNSGETITQIYSGAYHNLIVTSHGRVLTFGYNAYGQLGDGSTTNRLTPVDITHQFNFTQGESVADAHLYLNQSLVITTQGRVFTFGFNNVGQLGVGHRNDVLSPFDLTPSLMLDPQEDIIMAMIGSNHGLLLTSLGNVKGWGNDSFGQFENDDSNSSLQPIDITMFINISEQGDIRGVSVGNQFSLVYTENGQILAFGISGLPFLFKPNENIISYFPYDITHRFMIQSQLSSSTTPSQTVISLDPPNKEGYTFDGWFEDKALTIPVSHTLMPEQGLNLYAKWTKNTYTVTFETSGGSPELDSLTLLYGSHFELPVLQKEGSIVAGWYTDPQLTIPFDVKTYYKVIGWNEDVPEFEIIEYIYWPSDDIILYAKWENDNVAVEYYCLEPFDDYTVSFNANSGTQVNYFLLNSDGTLYGFGSNDFGHIGNGTTSPISSLTNLTPYLGLHDQEIIVQVYSGPIHTLFLTSEGRLLSVGDNRYGSLGDGTIINRLTPVDITQEFNLAVGETIVMVGATDTSFHNVVVTSANRVFTWGRNHSGQLGLGYITPSSLPQDITTPQDITDSLNLAQGESINKITLGMTNTGLLTSNGRVIVFGGNELSALGNDDDTLVLIPYNNTARFNLEVDEVIVGLELTYRNGYALTSNGRIFAWGSNYLGAVGSSFSGSQAKVPFDVTAQLPLKLGENVTQIYADSNRVYYLTSEGRVFVHGESRYCIYGICLPNTYFRSPIEVSQHIAPGEKIAYMSLGNIHNLFVTENGRAYRTSSVSDAYEITYRLALPVLYHEGQVEYGTMPDYIPTSQHGRFGGWYSDIERTTLLINPITEETSLYGWWIKTKTITFDTKDGSTVDPIIAFPGDSITAPSSPVKDGYMLDYWSISDPDAPLHWRSYVHNGSAYLTETIDGEIAFTVNSYVTSQYTSWHLQFIQDAKALGQTPIDNKGLIVFESGKTYRVSYDIKGTIEGPHNVRFGTNEGYWVNYYSFTNMSIGTNYNHQSFEFTLTQNSSYYTLPAFMTFEFGLYFNQMNLPQTIWVKNIHLEVLEDDVWVDTKFIIKTQPYTFDVMPDRDLTLYAIMRLKEYMMTFDSNGGTPVDTLTATHGSLFIEPDQPSKDGHVFLGWFLDESPYDFSIPTESNLHLEAAWQIQD